MSYPVVGSNVEEPTTTIIQKMNLNSINRIIAGIILLTNIYFIPANYVTIKESGGPMGYGLLFFPILLLTNLLLIPAGLTLKDKYANRIILLIINGLGMIWNLFWLWLLLTIPKMD